MEIKKLKLGKGRFELIRIGNMRFERCDNKWIGFMENKDEDIPIFANSDEGYTFDQIRNCYRATAMFLKSIENRNRKKMKTLM